MTEQQYQIFKRRLASDREFLIILLASARGYFLSKVGEWVVDILLWALGKAFKLGMVLVWPLMVWLKANGYINLGDGVLQAIKETLK